MGNSKLSPHEKRVLGLLIDGKLNKEISAETHCSLQSVKNSLSHIYHYFGVRNSRGLFRLLDAVVAELDETYQSLLQSPPNPL